MDPDLQHLRRALRLARRGYGRTAPNPMVGALLVRNGRIIGQGWHRQAGGPHAEIAALHDATTRGHSTRGATLYVSLEPCSTHGRTPPCTAAIARAGIARVVAAATDPNPAHAGRGFRLLRQAGIRVESGLLAAEATRLNEGFNHWIVHRTPFVTVKAAMTLDGKIATAAGESKWITGQKARAEVMRLRAGADAILVGVNTVLLDDPRLTIRGAGVPAAVVHRTRRRIVLDSQAQTPLTAHLIRDGSFDSTIIVTTRTAPRRRVDALAARVTVWQAPFRSGRIDLGWVLRRLGEENVTRLLVEGGGEVNAAFLLGGFAHEIVFFYAPTILGGAKARRSVAGDGVGRLEDIIQLAQLQWRRFDPDLMLRAQIAAPSRNGNRRHRQRGS